VVEYLNGSITKEEMLEKIKMESRRYAKRQITWFKKDKETIWLNGQEKIEKNINIIMENVLL
jgi:tRNA dimethylallyltransferase